MNIFTHQVPIAAMARTHYPKTITPCDLALRCNVRLVDHELISDEFSTKHLQADRKLLHTYVCNNITNGSIQSLLNI